MTLMRISRINSFVMIICVVILGMSCSESTKHNKVSIIGKVSLEGLISFEGVSVYLYKANVVQEDLSTIHQEHSSVGFTMEDMHFFDHREFVPLYCTTTNPEGVFEFESVEQNEYIMVLLCDGYGPVYKYNFEASTDLVDATPQEPIVLREIITIPQYVSSDYTFETGRAYYAEEDVTFLPESQLIFQGGSTLLICPGKGIVCYGAVSYQSSLQSPVRITSGDCIYDTAKEPEQFSKFEISSLASIANIEGLLFSYSMDGFVIKSSDFTMQECVFKYNNIACLLNTGSRGHIANTYFMESRGVDKEGLYLHAVSDFEVGNCVFQGIDTKALSIVYGQDIQVCNCWFDGGKYQLFNSFSSHTEVVHCSFSGAAYGLTNTAQSTLDIQNCDVAGEVCVYTYHTGNQGNSISNGWTRANYNNFTGSTNTVRATAQFYTYQHEYVLMDFKNNYWGTINQTVIEQSIIDFNDLEPYPQPGNIWPLIEFVPFRTSEVVDAGIQ